MNCSKCGQALTGGSAFCSRCGTPTGVSPDLIAGDEPTFFPVKGSEVLDGKWRLERKIGEGGMGAVYLAHDLQLDRKVAIKILASSLAHDAELVARFEREARFTASLEHPNIVPIYAVGRFKARPFMVMKYLEGQPLSAMLRNQSVLPLDQVLALTRQVCAGLEFIHAKGYVHRDIKAGNIFVSPAGLATILDFGILRPKRNAESLTRTGMVMGTPQYMSPEQALGERDIDNRSDLYALAIVIYECLAGALPFDSDSDLSIIQMQAHAPAPDICARANWISRPVGDCVMRALAKNPQERYQSAGELASAFEAAVALQDMFHDSAASINLPAAPPEPLRLVESVPADPLPPPAPIPSGPPSRAGSPATAPSARMSGPKGVPTSTVPVRLTPVSAPRVASGPKLALVPPLPQPPAPEPPPAPPVPGPEPATDVDSPPQVAAEPPTSGGSNPNELAQAVRRRRGPMVAGAAVLGVLVLGIAYFALQPKPSPTVAPPGELTAAVPSLPLDPPPTLPAEATVAAATPGGGEIQDDPSQAAADGEPEETALVPAEEVGAEDGNPTEEATASPGTGQTQAQAPPPAPGQGSSQTSPPPPRVRHSSGSSSGGTPGIGKVNVITTYRGGPYWASIKVNGEARGTTPALLELPVGKHQIRLERAGFKPIEKQIKVASGRPAVLRIELTP